MDPDATPGPDSERPLTDRGREQFLALAQWIVSRGIVPEQIVHSTLLRAVETADILAGVSGIARSAQESAVWLGSIVSVETLASHLRGRVSDLIAVVGHEPSMSHCTSQMIGGGRHVFRPGSVACIEFAGSIVPGAGRLQWLLSPCLF